MKKFIFYNFVIILLISLNTTAHASTGTIDSSFYTTKVCYDTTCISPTPGILNFRPTGATAVVVDDVSGLSGKVWGNELGWIDLNPTGEGIRFANQSTGLLTGKAWSQVSGWINFAPTGQSVTINPSTGELGGWAWTGGPYGGWIKFDCTDSTTCIKTSWRAGTTVIRSGGGGHPRVDVCPNIADSQTTIPQGYTIDQSGACVYIVDECPNLSGYQLTVPLGFERDSIGACIVSGVDFCPNIPGAQKSIPAKHTINKYGSCIPFVDVCQTVNGISVESNNCGVDQCTNIVGVQKFIPSGYEKTKNECFLKTIDMCANISGNQSSIPQGMIIDLYKNCIDEPIDLCTNLGGYQEVVPIGFFMDNDICSLTTTTDTPPPSKTSVIAFHFIPESLQMPSNNSALKNLVGIIVNTSGKEYRVDLVSIGVGILALIGIVLIIRKIFRLVV